MSDKSIQIDFNEACAQAKKLEDCAEEMKRQADQTLADAINEMAASWKGESADAYFAKAETVREGVAATADRLSSIACSIREQAQRTYDAEMAALRLAEQSGAGHGGGGRGGRGF
jgi:WXG100 family type VII secretion target